MEKLINDILKICDERNLMLAAELRKIKALWEHGFRMGYDDIASAVEVFIVSAHKRTPGHQYEDWELEVLNLLDCYSAKIENSKLQRWITDVALSMK